jgi:hypothetical protein
MMTDKLEQLKTIIGYVVDDMEEDVSEFLADVERGHHENYCDYSEDTPGEYGAVLETCLAKILAADKADTERVMSAIKDAILALNELEEQYGLLGGFMIFYGDEDENGEKTRGEKVRELILLAAAEAGVGDGKEDLTGEWRVKW